MRKCTFSTDPYNAAGNITLDPLCNGMSIKNTGNSVCVFNNDPLQPGTSKSIWMEDDDILEVRASITFRPIDNPPVGYIQDDECIVTQMFYLPTDDLKRKLKEHANNL